VGNSSSGIIEAPFAGTPSVNVGARQTGRQVGGRCVLHTGESLAAVRAGLRRACRRRPRRAAPGPYGDGGAGRRIAQILAGLPETARLTRKLITY
jgi:UDP-N-acetylglucosamine 2-epimerase (non-hydrolysing)